MLEVVLRVIVALLGLYVVLRGSWRLARMWPRVETEPRLLWIILVLVGAVVVFANGRALAGGSPVTSSTYASLLPVLLAVAVVSLPERYRTP